jgi:hypothetical protein
MILVDNLLDPELKVVKNPLPLVGFLEQHIAEAVIIEI